MGDGQAVGRLHQRQALTDGCAVIVEHVQGAQQVIPLYHYRQHSSYTLRTNARDRFGTLLEQRLTREQLACRIAGLLAAQRGEGAMQWADEYGAGCGGGRGGAVVAESSSYLK